MIPAERRESAITLPAVCITLVLGAIAAAGCLLTDLRFAELPNLTLVMIAFVGFDLLCRFAPPSRTVNVVRTIAFSVLFLIILSVIGAIASYATQRLSLPLQDRLFERMDLALGFNWVAWAKWVDRHPLIADVLALIYGTIALQLATPVLMLAIADEINELRSYLISVAIALSLTVAIAMLLPAAGYLSTVDEADFSFVKFSGATPLLHLDQVRADGSATVAGLGGLLALPSYHAVVAVLVPLSIRRYTTVFWLSTGCNATMFVSALTEGAHYACDLLSGAAVALFAHTISRFMWGRSAPKAESFTMQTEIAATTA